MVKAVKLWPYLTKHISVAAGILTLARSTVQCSSLELRSYLNSNSSVPRAAEERTHENRETIIITHKISWFTVAPVDKMILFRTCWNKLKACERTEISAAHHAFTRRKSNLVEQHLSHESEQNSSHVNTLKPLRSTFIRAGDEHAYILHEKWHRCSYM